VRLPNSVHKSHPWVISQIAPDFKLLDAWALPVYGGPDDLESVREVIASFDPTESGSATSNALFAIRLLIGRLLGWDDPDKKRAIPGCVETTLRDRLPENLRGSADDSEVSSKMQRVAGGFNAVYRTDKEWAAEISNSTVHGVLHLAWVDQGDGGYRAQMGVYVKPRGLLGEAYMKLISPFRHLIVYPALMRQIERAWQRRRVTPK
jgi:hypothetical protein